jgi:hypothetical protein
VRVHLGQERAAGEPSLDARLGEQELELGVLDLEQCTVVREGQRPPDLSGHRSELFGDHHRCVQLAAGVRKIRAPGELAEADVAALLLPVHLYAAFEEVTQEAAADGAGLFEPGAGPDVREIRDDSLDQGVLEHKLARAASGDLGEG